VCVAKESALVVIVRIANRGTEHARPSAATALTRAGLSCNGPPWACSTRARTSRQSQLAPPPLRQKGTDAQLKITELVCRLIAESDLERELAAHADLPHGLAWGAVLTQPRASRRCARGSTRRIAPHARQMTEAASPLGRRMKAPGSPSYNVSYAPRSLSASSSTTRTMPNTAWRIVAWPKARRLAASFGNSLRAGW
jgi:hypothetical protein